jgi:hypothetical protein
MLRHLILTAFIYLLPFSLLADEVWTTELGDVVYERETDGMAVLSVPLNEVQGLIYLPGLAGNYDDRSAHKGFWISDEVGPCRTQMQSPEGLMSDSWGRVEIFFDNPAFPTGWTMQLGSCFADPDVTLRGELK